MDFKKIKKLAEAQQDYMMEMRRYFHTHAEVSDHEFGTRKVLQRELDSLNIPYELKRTAYRFDQPFRNWEEARLFFETYRRRDDASLITDGFLREKLEPTGDAAFPWHIPVVRRAGIFVFQTSKIPEKLPHEANQEGKRK